MKLSVYFLIFSTIVTMTQCRPSRLVKENDGETADTEYEDSGDNVANNYFHEDQESTMAEDQRRSETQARAFKESQEQGDLRDLDIASEQKSAQYKDGYEAFSDNQPSSRKERGHREYVNLNNEEDYISEKEQSKKYQPIEDKNSEAKINEFYSRLNNNQVKRKPNELSMNSRNLNSAPDYGHDLLFKMKPIQARTDNKRNSEPEEASESSGEIEQYSNNEHGKNPIGGKKFENTYKYDRDRRHIQNVEEKRVSDSTSAPNEKEEIDVINESSENAIVKNIKKLSEQDLEELLNSLPDEKKALLKKIMDKREIAKKAGAVEENSYLEGGQSDTSKIQGGYSVDLNTESALSSNTPETSKHTENGEIVNTKNSDSESGSGATVSKSELNQSKIKDDKLAIQEGSESSIIDLKNVNIHSDSKELSKTEYKRQTKREDILHEKILLGDSENSNYPFDAKHSNDLPNQEDLCSENEDWLESRNEDPQEMNANVETHKREVSQNDQSGFHDCVKSLEDSFPAIKSYDENNLETEMVPLIRVKRTEKDHLKTRDSRLLSNGKVSFSPGNQRERSENEEKSELEDYAVFDHQSSNFKYNDQNIKSNTNSILDNGDSQRRLSPFIKQKLQLHPGNRAEIQKIQFDKMSLGSDTDSVLSGIEGVDDNLMYNSVLRGKRALEDPNFLNRIADKISSSRNARTAGPMNVVPITDNAINEPQHRENEAFGQLSRNSEDGVSRYKRVRQINQISSQEINSQK